MSIAVGEKREIYKTSTDDIFCIDITAENIDSIQRYDRQDQTDADWRFGDPCSSVTLPATISFTEDNGFLKINVHPVIADEELVRVHAAELHHGRGRRSRKVKKSKSSKKRSIRRRRSSKARKSRKSRTTRRR